MEKTQGLSFALVIMFVLVLAAALPAAADMTTITIPDDIVQWVQAYHVIEAGIPKAVLYEEAENWTQESWILTETFNLAPGLQKVSFDMGYYSGGGDETDEFYVWLKDGANIISPVSTSMLFPWKSSEHAGSSPPQPVEMFYDSVSGLSGVQLQFYLFGDGDLNYNPTMINISNIQYTTPPFVVPAPGALLLAGFGATLVGALRRTRRTFNA